MSRRVLATFSTLALMLTILPNMPASEALGCCNGIMCPMHAAPRLDCAMDVHGSSTQLEPCPVPAVVHYTAASTFVLLAPLILHDDAPSEPVVLFRANFSPDAERRVDSPPPRLPLAA